MALTILCLHRAEPSRNQPAHCGDVWHAGVPAAFVAAPYAQPSRWTRQRQKSELGQLVYCEERLALRGGAVSGHEPEGDMGKRMAPSAQTASKPKEFGDEGVKPVERWEPVDRHEAAREWGDDYASREDHKEYESKIGHLLTDSERPDSGGEDEDVKLHKQQNHSDGAGETAASAEMDVTPWSPALLKALGLPLPGSERYPSDPLLVVKQQKMGAGNEFSADSWSMKTAIGHASVHGTKLNLLPGRHGPFNTVHSFPEEHDEDRVWADPLEMKVPCHLLGEADVTKGRSEVLATLIIVCGTVGVGPCRIQHLYWTAMRASCIYVFGGQWQVSSCDIRSGHPAGDAIYCRGTSRLALPRKFVRRRDGSVVPFKYCKFPPVTLDISDSCLGGLRHGTPTGWGVMVCDRAKLSVVRCVVEYCHQALGVVDWCRAAVRDSILTHNGNAVWFGNKAEVILSDSNVTDTVCAFSLRTACDRGTKCMKPEQDVDNGCHARLLLRGCIVDVAPVFDHDRLPGTFVNTSNTFTTPRKAPNSSLVRPSLPYIQDPESYHMKNTGENDLSDIATFGADPGLVIPNPEYGKSKVDDNFESNRSKLMTGAKVRARVGEKSVKDPSAASAVGAADFLESSASDDTQSQTEPSHMSIYEGPQRFEPGCQDMSSEVQDIF